MGEIYISTITRMVLSFLHNCGVNATGVKVSEIPNSTQFLIKISTVLDISQRLNDTFLDYFRDNNWENWEKEPNSAEFYLVEDGIEGKIDLKDLIQWNEKSKLKGTKKPDDVTFILKRLNEHGYSAYVVGGCVRDASMSRDPHDWDITTSAKPDQVEQVFSDHKIIETGLQHGTVTVMRNGEGYEITTYRIDGDYSDGRHPDEVAFTGDVVEDLKRRDFTMNAIALDDSGEVVDPFDGCSDIYSKTVRCVGSPIDRFNEDALRIMRAIRFAAVFNFTIDEYTKEAIFKLYRNLSKVSKERINAELTKIAKSPHLSDSLDEYQEVFAFVLGIDGWNSPRKVENEDIITKFAYMFRNVEDAEWVMSDLKFDGETRDKVIELVRAKKTYTVKENDRVDIKLMLNLFGEEQLQRLAIIQGKDITETLNKVRDDCYTIKGLAIDGNDIMALGYSGKEVGLILKEVLTAVIYERVENNKGDLIELVKNYKG